MQIICSVHDSKAEAYLPPWATPNPGMARRVFQDALTDPKHGFCQHPEDFTLFHIADWDEQTGELIPVTNKSLGNGVDFTNHLTDLAPLEAVK